MADLNKKPGKMISTIWTDGRALQAGYRICRIQRRVAGVGV
jgi:hypothetical protein